MSHNALSKGEVSAQLKNNFKHVIGQNRNNRAWQLNQSINQSIIKSHMSGSHQNPFILHELISQIPLYHNYEKKTFMPIKIKRSGNGSEEGRTLADRIPDVRHPEKVGHWQDKIRMRDIRRRWGGSRTEFRMRDIRRR